MEISLIETTSEDALTRARKFLQGSVTIIHNDSGEKWGWRQFLDETSPPYIGTYGTACGILGLISCGEPQTSEFIQNPTSWLVETQLREGCWTTSSLGEDIRLITLTTYPLEALLAAGFPSNSNTAKNSRLAILYSA